LGQAGDKEKFRLSFAGATIHDMFNVMSVLVMLPLEMATNYLEVTSKILVKPLQNHNPNAKEPEMLNAITKPLTNSIIQIEKSVLDKIATNQSSDSDRLIKQICKKTKNLILNETFNSTNDVSNRCIFDNL
jgi:sodium-dependent phosphate cotransporter